MNLKLDFRTVVIEVICFLYMLLFVYAALSKLFDFENFGIQIGQSPMLSAFAAPVSWTVPVLEIIIAAMLASKCRLLGLYAAFSLMVMFTVYIYIILTYSTFVPCSCGGILEKLGWREHMIFNLVFIAMALLGIILITTSQQRKLPLVRTLVTLTLCAVAAGILVVTLFKYSESIIHHDNNFTRRFLPYAVKKDAVKDIRYDSYYFAGTASGRVYLANYTAPSLIEIFDNNLTLKSSENIELFGAESIIFKSVQVKVTPPHFFVLDGTVPCIFRGGIKDWKGRLAMKDKQDFSAATIIDSANIAFRTRSKRTGENILGTLALTEKAEPLYSTTLLQKQFDGVFDTDGTLHYSQASKQLVYTYFYRNQFIVADRDLKLNYRGNTIDTTSTADLKVKYLKSKRVRKFSAPPNTVNARTAVYGNFLLVNSTLRGQFEQDRMWKNSSVIDVYDLNDTTYRFSFYVNDYKGKKLSAFAMNDTHFFAMLGTHLISYKLGQLFYENGARSNSKGGLKAPRK